jgi:transposase-like protein
MGNILHQNAKTMPRIREEIQNSKESIATLAVKYNVNPKTIMKWKHRPSTGDNPSLHKEVKSSLSVLEQQVICDFRRKTLLPLDDVYTSLKDQIPALTRSNLHRCLKRNGLNRLPEEEKDTEKKKFNEYKAGYIHMDITEVRTETEKLYLFVAIDRVTKYIYVELHPRMTIDIACGFLENFIKDYPIKTHKILTDNGSQFTYELLSQHLRPKNMHPFDVICKREKIEHRLTKFRHPWTNGQVEVTNRMIKRYTTKTYHYSTDTQLKEHLMAFILFYNCKKKLKSLKFKTPYDKILELWAEDPTLFRLNPYHNLMGLNT